MLETADRPDATTPYVFISYASADRERVLPVVAALQHAGVPVWIDRVGIAAGANYGEEIAQAIKGSVALVLMTSAASLASRNVKQEVALAWEHERPYVPLLLEAVTIPIELQYWLTAAQWTEVRDKPDADWLPPVLATLTALGIAPAPPPPEAEIHLAGRERQQEMLRERLAATKAGQGSLVLIGGEAGVGKTTLAEATMRAAERQGCVVLEGHCFDLAETPPYGPWIDLFLRLPALPGLPALPPAFAERGTVGAVPSQMALFSQVQDFLVALAKRQPVVLLLDDLHWADPASLDLLRFLARLVATTPLLILVTYRSDELTRRHPLYQLLPQLARDPSAARLDLRALDDAAVRALVQGRYGLPEPDTLRLSDYVQARAEGNALFVGELLRSLEEAGALRQEGSAWIVGELATAAIPTLLRQVIDGRLARLDEESQRLLAVAAVVGHEVPYAVWAQAAEVDEERVLDCMERAEETGVVGELPHGEGARFAHALIREALYEGLPSVRRRRLHRRVGEALAEQSSPDPDAVAYHFQQAGDDRAAEWLLRAGERAQAAYAWRTAAARFEGALARMEGGDAAAGGRGWLLLRLSRLLRYADVAKARAFVDEAVTLGFAANDGAFAAYARYQCGLLACFGGDVTLGLPEMEAGADALAALSEAERAHFAAHTAGIAVSPRVPQGYGTVVFFRAIVGRFHEARELGERLVVEAAEGDEEVLQSLRDGYQGLGMTYAALGMPDEASAMFGIAHDAYHRAGQHTTASVTSSREMEYVALPYRAEDIAGRRYLAERAEEEYARASGAVPATIPPRFMQVPLLLLEGEWGEAERLASAASAETGGVVAYREAALAHLAALARMRGDGDRARWAVRTVLSGGSATQPGTVAFYERVIALQEEAAALALDEGDLSSAKEWLDAHDSWLARSGAALRLSEGQALWARYYDQSGDKAKADEHAQRALAHATEPRQPLALLAAHRLLGELATDVGRFADADTHLAASLALADACAAPYERALTLLALATLRAATGEHETARTLLAEVTAICTPLGAKPALDRAAALAATLR